MTMFDQPLPGWTLVDIGSPSPIAGWTEEVEIAGTPFVRVTPPGGYPRLINAEHVNSIQVCDEATVRTRIAG